MKTKALFFLLLLAGSANSQTINYNDVAVIINDNSQTSIDIGNYFQQARNIPTQNMIHISAPTYEQIDSNEFEQIRSQIESYLITNNLVDSFNYLVTTKGVPLKIGEGFILDTNSTTACNECASFDSEIALILGGSSINIGASGVFINPFYNSTQYFSRSTMGIYLVTRLDAYTKQDVFNMIDRSGHLKGLNQETAWGILDVNVENQWDLTYFVNMFSPGYNYLLSNSWNAQYDIYFAPLTDKDNVFAYVTTGGQSLEGVSLNYTWTDGSICSLANASTAITFDPLSNPLNKLRLGDLIAEGCTGAHGYVGSTFSTLILKPEILFDRYLHTTENFNLAESYYMAERSLSWQAVIIGDPKASVVIDNTASIEESEEVTIGIYPNPSQGNVKVTGDEEFTSIKLFDTKGSLIVIYDELHSKSVELSLHSLRKGMYLIQVETSKGTVQERIVLN